MCRINSIAFYSMCAVSENKHEQPPQHMCYRNWSGSSASMETDIVSKGFRLLEKHHGVRYMRVTADGDSSVMATLIQSVLYGPFIQKIDCANHACKCYRAKDHPKVD